MEAEGEYQPPNPNIVLVERHFRSTDPPSLTVDETCNLLGKEFKFSFEPNESRTELYLVNKSSKAVWISKWLTRLPEKIMPGEKIKVERRIFYQDNAVDYIFHVCLGVDYDPEPTLQQDMLGLLRQEKFTDFKLKCGKEEFLCHRSILVARSSVLADAFTYSSAVDQLELNGFDPSDLKKMLDFLYSGRVKEEVDDSLRELADYLDIDLIEEQIPKLKPVYNIPTGGNLQALDGWPNFTYSLRHNIQLEPSFAAKSVKMTWTIPNFEAWKAAQPPHHIERLPEKRISFLDKEFVFECRLQLGQQHVLTDLVSRGEELAVLTTADSYYYFVPQPNSFLRIPSASKLQEDDLVVNINFTLLQLLDLDDQSQLQTDMLGLLRGSQFTDFMIICGEKEFPCNKAILAARSPGFAQFFEEDPEAEKLQVLDFLPAKVEQMLEFIYSETVRGDADMDLLRLASKFRIKGLVKLCGRSLAKTVTVANALDLLDVAESHPDGSLKNLMDSVLDFCRHNFWELRRSDEWKQKMTLAMSTKFNEFLMHDGPGF